MSNLSDFFGSSGGSASFPTIFLSKSQTWVPPQDGNIMIHVIGGGGSGGSGTNLYCHSGSAAGYCKKNTLAVTTSGSFTVVVGAGGGQVRNAVGIAGGTSTVAGTGLSSTLTSTGGAGGGYSGTTDPAAGVGSNGDVNTTGGQGGYYRGGGAVGLTGTGENGVRGERNGTGGECDIVGDLWSSTMGQIAGGRRGVSSANYTEQAEQGPNSSSYSNAGPFSGGGRVVNQRNAATSRTSLAQGGDAGIGGGGGAGIHSHKSDYCVSGSGGAGIVVIQYIP